MRRSAPWALLLLIALGVGLGAALGAAGSPGTAGPSGEQWVARVLAATKAAGTAHLDDTQVSTSPDPDLRGSSAGTGAIDFATGSFQITADHEMEWSSDSGGPIHRHTETTSEGRSPSGRRSTKPSVPAAFRAVGRRRPAGATRATSDLPPPTALTVPCPR